MAWPGIEPGSPAVMSVRPSVRPFVHPFVCFLYPDLTIFGHFPDPENNPMLAYKIRLGDICHRCALYIHKGTEKVGMHNAQLVTRLTLV